MTDVTSGFGSSGVAGRRSETAPDSLVTMYYHVTSLLTSRRGTTCAALTLVQLRTPPTVFL